MSLHKNASSTTPIKLFMVLLGCKPPGRNTEQHDVFFGIAHTLKELISEMKASWPEAEGKLHIDAWREVNVVDGYHIEIKRRENDNAAEIKEKLFFINLGGYKKGEFEEYHYKIVAAAANKKHAVRQSKQTAFYKHAGFKGAVSHVDDKYGIDVDDIYAIEDILSNEMKDNYSIQLSPASSKAEDTLHIGYLKLEKLAIGQEK